MFYIRISRKDILKYCKKVNCCKHLKSTNSFTKFTTKKKKNSNLIYLKSNYRSKNVIYQLDSTLCQKLYIKKSGWPFFTINNLTQNQIHG